MIPRAELRRRAKRRLATIERARRDPRFRRTLGRYVAAGVLTTTSDVQPHRDPIDVSDVLWAGRVEPRLLLLLPALIVKRPSLFSDVADLPDDLLDVVRALRRNREPPDFRGIPGRELQRWLPSVGRRGKVPSRLVSFRLQERDLDLLDRLKDELGLSRTEIVRRGLRRLATGELLERDEAGED